MMSCKKLQKLLRLMISKSLCKQVWIDMVLYLLVHFQKKERKIKKIVLELKFQLQTNLSLIKPRK